MSLRDSDKIIIDPDALAFIEDKEQEEGYPLAKFEVIEFFFEWLKVQSPSYKVQFIKLAIYD